MRFFCSLGDIISVHKALITDPFDHAERPPEDLRFLVRRGHIIEDTFRKLQRVRSGELINDLRVTFVGEPAIDEGGPRREFFTLFFAAIRSTSLLEGPSGQQIVSRNIENLNKQRYKFLGYVIVLSLMNGGPGPFLFHKAVAEKIVFSQHRSELSVDDIGDYELREHLLKVA